MNRYKEIEKITKMHMEQHNQLLRFFSRVDLSTRLKVFQVQKEIFFKLKNLHKDMDNTVLSYSSLIVSILVERRNTNKNAKIFKAKKFRRSLKREKILEKLAIIKSLKNDEKLSFRQIATYLRKYHKLNVSYSTIHKIWSELEEKNINKGEQKNG